MSENTNHDLGHRIGETVRSALQSGDLSRLKELGTVVEEATRTVNVNIGRNEKNGKGKTEKELKWEKVDEAKKKPPKAAGKPQPIYGSGLRPAGGQGYAGNVPLRYAPRNGTGVPAMVLGLMGFVGFGVASLVLAAIGAVFTGGFGAAALCAAASAGGLLLLVNGANKMGLTARLRKYCRLLEGKNVMTFDELAQATGLPVTKVQRDIRRGLRKNMLKFVRTDVQETTVMYGEDAWGLYLQSEENRKQREAEEGERRRLMEDPEKAEIVRFKEEGGKTLQLIRRANDAIPGEEISAKLATLEETTGKIFDYVEKHPEKLPDTRRFMDYYLPTTLKLLDKYRQYDENSVQVKSIVKAKAEIEDVLDTINQAFVNLLDNLYAEDTLDVSTDITVLQTMLAQEGLTGKKFKLDGRDD